MKISMVLIAILAPTMLGFPAWANELKSYDPPVASEQTLKRVPASNPEALGIPVYPNAKEITGDSLEQGSFQARSFIFLVPTDFKKVLSFYKERLGKTANLDLLQTSAGKQQGHFYLVAGSESRNVVLEEVSRAETRITLTVFTGGGGIV